MINSSVIVRLAGMFFALLPLAAAAQVAGPPPGNNQRSKVCQWMGEVEVCVTYNSPDVTTDAGISRRGQIWGKVVPYGEYMQPWLENPDQFVPKPWRAGANENTVISFSHDVVIEDKLVVAGDYGLFFITGEKEWQFVLSKDSNKWGAYFYDEKNDAIRVTVVPERCEYHEWLTYDFLVRKPDSTTLALMWEDLIVPIHIAVPDERKVYIEQIKNDLTSRKMLSWYNWHDAAQYCLEHNVELELGLTWADKAIDQGWIGNANFMTLKTKADILLALDRNAQADSLMQFAVRYAGGVFDLHNYGRELLAKKKIKEALSIFKVNADKHPDYWLTELGLARGYAAAGDFKTALKHAQTVRKLMPSGESGMQHYSLDILIQQLNRKEEAQVYLERGLTQVY